MISGRRKILLSVVANVVVFGLLFVVVQRYSVDYEKEDEFELFTDQQKAWLDTNHLSSFCVPYHDSTQQIIKHKYFMLSYNEETEQADWVAYVLHEDMTYGKASRKNNFKKDAKVKTESASSKDYHLTGFDRGHLLPAANMKFSQKAMDETFLMSNISPQEPGFNRYTWKDLEQFERSWARKNDRLYVACGPIIIDSSFRIGKNAVAIPQGFFKVILDLEAPEYKGIGFVMPNSINSMRTLDFAVTIDSIENLTGFDFFHELPDEIEAKLESDTFLNKWFEISGKK